MKIDRVRIKNFKSLRNVDVTLNNLTLITGVNSAGKSSFIQALLLLKQNEENIRNITQFNKIKQIIEAENETDLLNLEKVMIGNMSFLLNGDYVEVGNKKDVFYQEVYEEEISLEIYNGKNHLMLSFNEDLNMNVQETRDNTEKIYNLFYENFQYITTDRASPAILYPLSEFNISKNLIGLYGEYAAHYLSKNMRKELKINELKHPDSVTTQLLENVSLWLGEISNGINIFTKVYEELQQVNLTYQYTYGENTTNNYTPLNVGFGITYVLPIIVSILKAKPDDLLIIENPESHLHPAGQSKIAELCSIASSCGVQIIVETHSDHFLNGLRVATKKEIIKPEQSQIYYFSKEKDSLETKTNKLTIDKQGNINENWPKGFFDEYRNKLDELLW